MEDRKSLQRALLQVLVGKTAKTIAQLLRLKAIKQLKVDKSLLADVADELVAAGKLSRVDGRSVKYGIYEPTVEELLEARLRPIEEKLDKILGLLADKTPGPAVPAVEILQAILEIDGQHNCHNLVPLPLLFERFSSRLSLARFHQLLLKLAEDEMVDLQARSDRSALAANEISVGIEDPFRGLLYYVGRKV